MVYGQHQTTGIVQGKAQVVQLQHKDSFRSIRIRFPDGAMTGIQIGASVAINGTCLTVVQSAGDECQFDVIEETLRRTTLGELQVGSPVNYERHAVCTVNSSCMPPSTRRSARVGDEIGGHTVSGHVCCTASIAALERTEDNRRLQFSVPPPWIKYVLEKGFIAVDGCSLTVGEVGEDWFSVYLIPETLRVTVLGDKDVGDRVNIEVEAQMQAIVDTVEKVVKRYMEGKALA